MHSRRIALASFACALSSIAFAQAATPIIDFKQVSGEWAGRFQNGTHPITVSIGPDGKTDAAGPGVNAAAKSSLKDGKLIVKGGGLDFALEMKGDSLVSPRGSFGTLNGDLVLKRKQ